MIPAFIWARCTRAGPADRSGWATAAETLPSIDAYTVSANSTLGSSPPTGLTALASHNAAQQISEATTLAYWPPQLGRSHQLTLHTASAGPPSATRLLAKGAVRRPSPPASSTGPAPSLSSATSWIWACAAQAERPHLEPTLCSSRSRSGVNVWEQTRTVYSQNISQTRGYGPATFGRPHPLTGAPVWPLSYSRSQFQRTCAAITAPGCRCRANNCPMLRAWMARSGRGLAVARG